MAAAHPADTELRRPCGWAAIEPVEGGDWVGCAEALVAHGMPVAPPNPGAPDSVIVDGRRKRFSEAVTELLPEAGPRDGRPGGAEAAEGRLPVAWTEP